MIAQGSDDNGWGPFKRFTFLVLLAVLGMIVLGGAQTPLLLPGVLSGVWQTSSANYANCYMEFSPITIVFGTAEQGNAALYFVTRVEESKESGEINYLIHYTDSFNVRYEMDLRYKPGPNAILYLKNQPGVIWKKRPSA